MSRDADFTDKVRELVAKRAAYRCSVPDCRQTTIGPGASETEYACLGRCCHIHSSSPNGPRGCGGLSVEERGAPSNAFWACANHAALIDTNEGDRFPAGLLRSWKACHEAMLLHELKGMTAGFGWLEGLRFISLPISSCPRDIRFGKVTLFRGCNSTGKTAVCECLAALGDLRELWRWRDYPANAVEFEVQYWTPQKHQLRINAVGTNFLSYELDGSSIPLQPFPFRVVYCRSPFTKPQQENESDVAYLGRLLTLDPALIANLLPLAAKRPIFGVEQLWQLEKDYGIDIAGNLAGTEPGLSFRAWSHGEQLRVIYALGVNCAHFYSSSTPTVLVLDGNGHLDAKGLADMLRVVLSDCYTFQVVATLLPGRLETIPSDCTIVDFGLSH